MTDNSIGRRKLGFALKQWDYKFIKERKGINDSENRSSPGGDTFVAFISSLSLLAQHKVEMFPFGDMDQWVDRQIKESRIIGGNTKNVYEIAPTAVIQGDQVYKNMGGSPWGTSNVMAKVAELQNKYVCFPGKKGRRVLCTSGYTHGKCESVGLVNITVLAAGSIFTGRCMNLLRY